MATVQTTMNVDEGAREADSWREAQAIEEARAADGVSDAPQPTHEKARRFEMPDTPMLGVLLLAWLAYTLISLVFGGWAAGDNKSGMDAVHKLFDKSFGTLLTYKSLAIFALIFPATSCLFLIKKNKRLLRIVSVITMLALAVAYGYLFPPLGRAAHAQVSEWQQLPFPVNAAEEAIKTTYDIAYCVRVGRETCVDMSVEDATPLFNLTEWTKSASYKSVKKLCDANPGNDLAVCKSCGAVTEYAKAEGKVSRFAVKKGRYDEGVKWCGLFFGATNVSLEDQSYSPYLYRRTWLLKRLAKNAKGYVIFDTILAVSASVLALVVCLIIVENWWMNRKDRKESKDVADDGYVQHVEA